MNKRTHHYKILRTVFICLILFAVSNVFAQAKPKETPSPVPEKTLPPNKGIKYCCVKGNYSGFKPGKCPLDDTRLIQEGDYYCEVCDSTTTKPSKCKGCAHDMIKIECPVTVIKDEKEEY